MDFSQNVSFVTQINTFINSVMADGKIDKYDIPRIMLLITELISTTGTSTITTEELASSINSLYSYIMGHYNLFPTDELQKAEFKEMFDMCVKLALFQPNINKKLKSTFSCFR